MSYLILGFWARFEFIIHPPKHDFFCALVVNEGRDRGTKRQVCTQTCHVSRYVQKKHQNSHRLHPYQLEVGLSLHL